MTDNLIVDETLDNLLKEMRCYTSKIYKTKKGKKESKVYRISSSNLVKLKVHLMELYQKAFAQGVYTATWRGVK